MAPYLDGDILSERKGGTIKDSHRAQVYGDTHKFEPIAIVGLSFEFPQNATSSDAFWELLMSKGNTATGFPEHRLAVSAMYHPDRNRRGQIPVRSGHFIRKDIAAFDAPFFSISSSDAAVMDPQQRKLLEHTYKALENAGLPLEIVTGSNTSVYIGTFTNDWQQISFKDSEECGTTTALGTQPCVNANRISWFYNFKGNSANIDTACSSSLVALDFGCRDLRSGETNMSVVGGCNLIFSPDYMHSLSNMNMLSPDGQCYSFDHRGTGYGRGEGFGIMVLKRLSDALRDQDTIRAVIRNTGCNQDGFTPGITKPNDVAQESLIKETYSKAGLSMLPTRYIEAHGTGTPIGDPIEATALGMAFHRTRTSQDPLWVGAVKSNIGHLEGCSGIAAVIKSILVLEKGIIPPNTNFAQTNPKIDTEFLKIKFPLEPLPWPTKGLRRASVNSFGYAGTNAHTIIDDAFHYLQEHGLVGHHMTTQDPPAHCLPELPRLHYPSLDLDCSGLDERMPTPKILLFSAHDETGIIRQAAEHASYFAKLMIVPGQFKTYLDSLVYTLNCRRTSMTWKSFAVVHALEDLQRLEKLVSPAQKAVAKPSLGFIFTGQGAQWAGMGRELIVFPTFEKSLRDAEQYLTVIGCPWQLREEMFNQGEHPSMDRPDFSQPMCTAIQIALVDLLLDIGIHPTAVTGHSSGEIAAAYSCGAISAKAALKIAYCRGVVAARLVKSVARRGAMLAVGLSQADIQTYINEIAVQPRTSGLTIACINSPKNVTVSGDADRIESLKSLLDEKKIFARKLHVDVAYHSPHMQDVSDDYCIMIQDIEKGESRSKLTTMISSVTANKVKETDLLSPEYWVSNMVSPVRFSDALGQLTAQSSQNIRKKIDLSHRKKFSVNMLVEIGPSSALQGPIRDALTELRGATNISYTSMLIRRTSALESTLAAIGKIKCLGYPIDLNNINYPRAEDSKKGMALPNLPEYQFDHSKKYWYESRISDGFRTRQQGKLDLLGKPVPDWNPLEAKWRNHLRVSEMPWMEDHVINGALVYPGAGMIVMAIEAANQMADHTQYIAGFELKDIHFLSSINVPQDSSGLETQLILHLSPETVNSVSKYSEFRLFAYEGNQWHESCRGFIRVEYRTKLGEIDKGKESLEEIHRCREVEAGLTDSCRRVMNIPSLYESLNKSGFELGPAFQRIENGASGEHQQAKGVVKLFEWQASEYPQPHVVHPASLDAILQMAIAGYTDGGQKAVPTMVPSSLRHLWISKAGLSHPQSARVKACAWMTAKDNRGTEFDHSVLDMSDNEVLAQVQGMRLTIIAETNVNDSDDLSQDRMNCYHVVHQPDPDLLSADPEWAYYQKTQGGLKPVDRYLDSLAHKNPDYRMLEINAGVGGTITRLLSPDTKQSNGGHMDAQFSAYHYTDNAETVIDRACKLLQHHPRVIFGRLNTETDPLEQGYEAEAFDVLVAPNSSYQYKDVNVALHHIHQLLKIGGKLLLHGSVAPGDCSNGLSGSGELWREILIKNGFSGPSLKVSGAMNKISHGFVVFIKRAIPGGLRLGPEKRIALVTEPKSSLQAEVSARIIALLSSRKAVDIKIMSLSEAESMPDKDENVFIVLLELNQSIMCNLSSETYSILRQFLISARDVLWINSYKSLLLGKPENAVIAGLARVLRNEYEDHHVTSIMFEFQDNFTDQQLHHLVQVLEKNHISPGSDQKEPEYIEINGVMSIPRITKSTVLSQELHMKSMPQQSNLMVMEDAPPLSLTIGSPGLLDTLHFVEDKTFPKPLGNDEVEIRTEVVGMNFKDCLIALGQVSGSSFGLECAGVVTRVGREDELAPGDRVLMAAQGSFKTFARGLVTATCKVPEGMSFLDAAAIPAQFGTAWAVVHRMARIKEGETILVHAGAGGTGQACIQIARYFGATLFATVGSPAKRQLLMDEYGIPEEHLFDSRDTSFAKGVKRVTKGRGVDVVINSLVGKGMIASWECIAPYGRFIDISKNDIVSNSNLPMLSFLKNASFIGFDMSTLHDEKPMEVKKDLQTLVDLFANKTFHTPRPLHVYSIADVREVFRLLSSGKRPGKFVLEVSQQAVVPTTLDTKAGFVLDENATYVIAGGLGGLGRSIARWMIGRNARNLILLSRSGASTDVAHAFLEELKGYGVRVEAPPCDITNTQVMQQVLGRLIQDMPPVKGCIQGSMVWRDALFKNMKFEDWQSGVDCKTIGSWNLHKTLPRGMDFFVLLSSVSGIVGLRGQANYNVGNTYEDALARYRVAHGEKAISLDLGAMVDDGTLAENPDRLQRVLTYGALQPITRQRFFGILDHYCNPALPILKPHEAQVVIGIANSEGSGLDSVDLSRQPLLRQLLQESNGKSGSRNRVNEGADNLRGLFSDSASLIKAGDIVVQALIKKLSKSLPALQDSDVDIHKPIQSYGVDSLLSVELRNWIAKEFRADVAVFETQGASTFSMLGMLVAGRSGLKHAAWTM